MTLRASIAFLMLGAYSLAQSPPPSLTTLYSFAGGNDGANPHARVAIGGGGVLYGATSNGGTSNQGTIFSLTPPASAGGPWTETVLYSFQGGSDGAQPTGAVAIGSGGVLYGTTYSGGTALFGTVFSLTPPASPGGVWTETVLHSFGETGLGAGLRGGVAVGAAGVLYGTTQYGGGADRGTVFALAPPASAGGPWTASVLYSFKGGDDGNYPLAGVAIGRGGALYGTTFSGGTANSGTVFALTPPASPGSAWTETVLHSFTGGADGSFPYMGLAIGSGGVLYGTTQSGGSANAGAVFSVTPPAFAGGAWAEAVLHEFPSNQDHYPAPGPLALGKSGALYGTTQWGGASFSGTAFTLKPPTSSGGSWTEILLHTFAGADGTAPTGLAVGSGGVLYGTTNEGGTGWGTIFALTL